MLVHSGFRCCRSLLVPSVLPVRSCTVRRCPSTPCARRSSVHIWCRISLIDPIVSTLWYPVWTLSPKAVPIRFAGPRVVACEFLQDGGELLLQDFDALCHNYVGVQVAYGLEFEKELGGVGVVVEGFAVLRGFFPFGILGFWPARFKVLVDLNFMYRMGKSGHRTIP